MKNVLAFASMFVLFGCAQSSDDFVAPRRDSGKESGTLGDSGGGGDDSSVPPDETSTPPDDTGGGTCEKASAAGSECGLFPQCGCTGGKNCDVTTTDGKTQCVAAGSVGVNEACSKMGECGVGTSCIGGLCRPFCKTNSDCTSGACKPATYTPTGSTTPMEVPGLTTCFTSCNPLSPSGSCGSQSCTILDDGTSACIAAGSGTTKGSCSDSNPYCAAGYVCVGTGDCLKWCRVGSSTDCSGTSGTCTGFSTPVMYMGAEYGVCAY
jgi:hypothetical protein